MRIVLGTVRLGAAGGAVALVLALLLEADPGAGIGLGLVAAVPGPIGGFTATTAAEQQRRFRLARRAPIPERTVREWAQVAYPRWGWVPTGREPHGLIVLRPAKPDPWPAVFLLLLGVFPAINYPATAGRTVPIVATTHAVGAVETDLEIVASDRGRGGARTAIRFVNGLHEVAGESPYPPNRRGKGVGGFTPRATMPETVPTRRRSIAAARRWSVARESPVLALVRAPRPRRRPGDPGGGRGPGRAAYRERPKHRHQVRRVDAV
ncbi:MAG: hypothetical protein AVDCRST_MAG73-1110 [uncultured Thermomicrobiales bacterium]|uniref:Uncharacterized protein n=1 Tax=uncultured Thermomicrobiales bacterium TaxID=1645740 RepID=A0A6J4TUL0_9BACT|nr:MAG: hypothetical protein AVDCRST_MAG73-1110 [uncultured Thermomicrobiales bacterium]